MQRCHINTHTHLVLLMYYVYKAADILFMSEVDGVGAIIRHYCVTLLSNAERLKGASFLHSRR